MEPRETNDVYNCAPCTVSRDEAQPTLHVTESVPLSNSLGVATVYGKNSRQVESTCHWPFCKFYPPCHTMLDSMFQRTQRSVSADEQIFHHRGATTGRCGLRSANCSVTLMARALAVFSPATERDGGCALTTR